MQYAAFNVLFLEGALQPVSFIPSIMERFKSRKISESFWGSSIKSAMIRVSSQNRGTFLSATTYEAIP